MSKNLKPILLLGIVLHTILANLANGSETFYFGSLTNPSLYRLTLDDTPEVRKIIDLSFENGMLVDIIANQEDSLLFAVATGLNFPEDSAQILSINVGNSATVTSDLLPEVKHVDNCLGVSRENKYLLLQGQLANTSGTKVFLYNQSARSIARILPDKTMTGCFISNDGILMSSSKRISYLETLNSPPRFMKELKNGHIDEMCRMNNSMAIAYSSRKKNNRRTAYLISSEDSSKLLEFSGKPFNYIDTDNFYVYNKDNQSVQVLRSEFEPKRSFVASFLSFVDAHSFQVKERSERDEMYFNGFRVFVKPSFTDFYLSPSKKYSIFVYAPGYRYPAYIVVRDNETGDWKVPIAVEDGRATGLTSFVPMRN